MESNSQATLIEELESLPMDWQDLTKMLHVGKELNLEDKHKLKNFLFKNMDVFA